MLGAQALQQIRQVAAHMAAGAEEEGQHMDPAAAGRHQLRRRLLDVGRHELEVGKGQRQARPCSAKAPGNRLKRACPCGIAGAMRKQQQPVHQRNLTSQVNAAIDRPR